MNTPSNHILLDIHPTAELRFPIELKKRSSCSLLLTNKTANESVAFKVKTTNPRKYCVRPNMGIVLPGKTCDIIVTMHTQNDVPSPDGSDVLSKDKFLLQSVVVPHGATTNNITREMFVKEAGKFVEEFKLKVMHVIPHPVLPYDVVKVKCQICDMDTHTADMCPFMYTTCKVSKCSGIRRLFISKTANNPDRKFLKCQYSKCMEIQWLSDAILEANGSSTCTSTSTSTSTNNKEHFPAEIREPKTSKNGGGPPSKVVGPPKHPNRSKKGKKLKYFRYVSGSLVIRK